MHIWVMLHNAATNTGVHKSACPGLVSLGWVNTPRSRIAGCYDSSFVTL